MHIFIITGEASGEFNAGELVKSINSFRADIHFTAIGGTHLVNAGCKLLYPYSDINYSGFSSVVMNYSKIQQKFKIAVNHIKESKPSAVVLVDTPGFNLRIAEEIRKFYKGRIIYYISPQLWAWHKSRVEKVRKYVDRMLVLFPFEVDFYKSEDIKADYTGHPLVAKTDEFLLANKRLDNLKPIITLLPGSRKEEIIKIMPVLNETAGKLRLRFNAEIKIIRPPNIDASFYNNLIDDNSELISNEGDNYFSVILNSDFVITKFGTSSLECALLGTPFCTVYRTNFFNYHLAKSLANIKYVTMANILLDRPAIKEFIQSDFTSINLINEVSKVLTNNFYRDKITASLKEVRAVFNSIPVTRSAAEIIIDEVTH